MTKTYILLFYLMFSLCVFSQDGFQGKAKKISDEMSSVLTLDKETSEKVYYIQLKRFIDAQKIRKTYQIDKKQMKTELKKIQNRLWGKLNGVLGKEKMKLWGDYKKAKNKQNI